MVSVISIPIAGRTVLIPFILLIIFKETTTAIIVTNPYYSYIYFVKIGKLVRIRVM